MKWNKVEGGQLLAAFQKFVVALGEHADDIINKIINVEGLVERVVALILNDGYELSTSQARAREIMGKYMFGIEEAMKHFGVSPLKRQLAYMAEIPFTEKTLEACQGTHILVAFFPIAILDICAKTAEVKLPKGQNRLFYQQDWYKDTKQAFSRNQGQLEWHLIRKTPVVDSTSKTWEQQQNLLCGKVEETPEAQVMMYTIIGHFLNTGERLFEKVYVRTSSLDSFGCRVGVGGFVAVGLSIRYDWGGIVYDGIGVASSRKLES